MEAHPPWLDLPVTLTESILERLSLPDYVRFAAVCRRWRSIQHDNRRRVPPPKITCFPWLISSDLCKHQEQGEGDGENLAPCYSPFEHHRLYNLGRLPIPSRSHFCASSRGWILLQDLSDERNTERRTTTTRRKRRDFSPPSPLFFSLFNPISGQCIHLPPLHPGDPLGYYAAVSAPPTCAALLIIEREIFLFRLGDLGWTPLRCPWEASIIEATFCAGKFYCTCPDSRVVVVDISSHPTVGFMLMDECQMPDGFRGGMTITTECDGELLLVKAVLSFESPDEEYEITRFRVFKADLLRNIWVRVESLGDRMLLLAQYSSLSLVADDVGGRRNCIYFSEALIGYPWSARRMDWTPWKVFDLGTESMSGWPLPADLSEHDCSQIKEHAWRWIVPSLDTQLPAHTPVPGIGASLAQLQGGSFPPYEQARQGRQTFPLSATPATTTGKAPAATESDQQLPLSPLEESADREPDFYFEPIITEEEAIARGIHPGD